jgi:opacity protein-like surface antigen
MRAIPAGLLISTILCCCGSLEYASAQDDFMVIDSKAPVAAEVQDLIIKDTADSLFVGESVEQAQTLIDFDQPAKFPSAEPQSAGYLEGEDSVEQWPADQVAAEVLPTTALTQDLDKTISVAGGANWVDGNSGYAVIAAIGKRISPKSRIDLEFTHRSNQEEVDLVLFNPPYSRITSKAKLDVTSIMANWFGDWNNTTRFTPYGGVGMGISFIRADDQTTGFGDVDEVLVRVGGSQKDTVFTSQVIGGVAYRIGTRSDIYVEYRRLVTSEVIFDRSGPVGSYKTHNLMLGYRKKF